MSRMVHPPMRISMDSVPLPSVASLQTFPSLIGKLSSFTPLAKVKSMVMVLDWSMPIGMHPSSMEPPPPPMPFPPPPFPEPSPPPPFPEPSPPPPFPPPPWLELQPTMSTASPAGVLGQESSSSTTPSLSASAVPLPEPSPPPPFSSGQPSLSASFSAVAASLGQLSLESGMPSPSVSSLPLPPPPPPFSCSSEHPFQSTSAPSAVFGQSSKKSSTPSQSWSSVQERPEVSLLEPKPPLVSMLLLMVRFS